MIQMYIAGVGIDAYTGRPIILLDDSTKRRILPIWISVAEFIALARTLDNTRPERPMTHDLLLNAIDELGYTVQQIEVDELMPETYFATVRLLEKNGDGVTRVVDARPCDAITIALKAGVPIYVSSQVMANGTVPADAQKEVAETHEFQDFLKDLKASDFNIYS